MCSLDGYDDVIGDSFAGVTRTSRFGRTEQSDQEVDDHDRGKRYGGHYTSNAYYAGVHGNTSSKCLNLAYSQEIIHIYFTGLFCCSTSMAYAVSTVGGQNIRA